jgi:DNA-directed RNA polymerase subunit beta'
LGKRVDYSGRSVIVVGPTLKLHECGIPKGMAAELFKPFIIRKLIERGVVKTVKSAKKLVDRKDSVIWDILENILKGHPVLLNRAPTLHRLSIQAFQPQLVEGKAIQLHPLVCGAFNADFDGDQMAVHVPLSNEAILEAQLLMLSSHNILNPQNGTPIALPSQDMVLGLYYITKERKGLPESPMKGEGKMFYSTEEVIIAFNERALDLHSIIKVKVMVRDADGELSNQLITTTTGRVLFNEVVPTKVGFINKLLSKKELRTVIGDIIKVVGISRTARFLDDIKKLGFEWAFKGGLSFSINDLLVPSEKVEMIQRAQSEVDEVASNYEIGLITNNERYNQVIDIWTRLGTRISDTLIKGIEEDKQGFNALYMMFHSGATGFKRTDKAVGRP